MIFTPENADKVKAGTKTATRRIVGSRWYKPGQEWAVQPGRNLKAICRIRLTDVRQEPLQNIALADVVAEGCADLIEFARLWDRLNPRSPWADSPIVWVLTFEMIPPVGDTQ